MSHQSKGTYEAVADLPLVQGKSRISDALCADWVRITTREIPPSFWQVLNQSSTATKDSDSGGDGGDGLKEERTWLAIQRFAQNCMARDRIRKKDEEVYEGIQVEHQGERRDAPPSPITNRYDKASTLLSTKEVISLVQDQGR
jgi:hypothetical protein